MKLIALRKLLYKVLSTLNETEFECLGGFDLSCTGNSWSDDTSVSDHMMKDDMLTYVLEDGTKKLRKSRKSLKTHRLAIQPSISLLFLHRMSSSSKLSTSTITSFGSVDGLEEDHVTPSQDKITQTFARSKQLWQFLSRKASSVGLQRDTVRLSDLNHGLRAIPDDLQARTELAGQATWQMRSTGCTVPCEARNGGKRRWMPARLRPTLCMISGHSSFNHSDSKSNGIALLFFGWAYILCMSLLEKQHVSMSYANTPEEAPADGSDSEQCLTVDVGNVSGEEYCWWAHLLSPGQGWRSVTPEQPVWAIAYTANIKFRLVARITTTRSLQFAPPSSKQAVAFLSRFASMYNLDGQAPLALAMALTLPLHNETSSMVKLPKPSLIKHDTRSAFPSSFDREYSNLAHYMTLSSNPVFLSSTLWAVFWEAGVDCNLVSPWCDPIIEVVKPLIECDGLEKLGHVLALRRPNIAPLWYGIAACGHTKTILAIVPYLRNLHSPVPSRPIPEVAAWTDSPQSFMDLQGVGPYVQENNQVARIDVWRLRHQFWGILHEPQERGFGRVGIYRIFSAWKPPCRTAFRSLSVASLSSTVVLPQRESLRRVICLI